MDISTDGLYFNFIKHENVASIELYHKFLNWISGEFDLYQKDEFNGVKVYYPNGWFTIKNTSQSEVIISMEINVVCKSRKIGLITVEKIELLFNRLINI